MEVSGQAGQLTHMREAVSALHVPVHVIHGDADDFAPIEIAEKLVAETRTRAPIRFLKVPGANHFFNDGPVETLVECLEACIPAKALKPAFQWPTLPDVGAWLAKKFAPHQAVRAPNLPVIPDGRPAMTVGGRFRKISALYPAPTSLRTGACKSSIV